MFSSYLGRSFLQLSFLTSTTLLISACELTGVSTTSGFSCSGIGACIDSASDGGTPVIPTDSDSVPFTISIKSYWEDDSTKSYPHSESAIYHIKKNSSGDYVSSGTEDDLDKTDACNIKAGTTLNSSATDRQRTCGVLIPETRLYFSRLEFTVNIASNASCEVVGFTPLSYQVSSSATFRPIWTSASTDCSGYTKPTPTTPPLDCFSGPGTKLITGFPNYRRLVTLLKNSTISNSLSWTAESAHENKRGDNRWAAYYPLEPYPVSTMLNWTFECVNEGSRKNFEYTLRIIPTRDSGDSVGEQWDRYLGWVDDDGIFNDDGF